MSLKDGLVPAPIGGDLRQPERCTVAGDVEPVPQPRDRKERLVETGQLIISSHRRAAWRREGKSHVCA